MSGKRPLAPGHPAPRPRAADAPIRARKTDRKHPAPPLSRQASCRGCAIIRFTHPAISRNRVLPAEVTMPDWVNN